MGNKKVIKAKSKSEERRMAAMQKDEYERDLAELCDPEPSFPNAYISYKSLPGGKVIITGFEGIFTLKDIRDSYGDDVLTAYEENEYRMCLQYDFDGETRLKTCNDLEELCSDTYYVGDVLSNEDFSKLVGLVKKCGRYLHELKEAIHDGEEKIIGV